MKNANDDRMRRLLSGAVAMLVALAGLIGSPALAGEPAAQKRFASPQLAVAALIAALQDDNDDELLAVLGPGSEDLIFSGDLVADQNGRERFLTAFAAKNRLEEKDGDRAVLIVGEKDYPFPLPVVREGDAWHFDSMIGRVEILNRRIGRNELHTIEVMHTYTDAQREYVCRKKNGGIAEFAQKLNSSEGKKDGLYWPAGEGEEASPFGPLIARATEEGYAGRLDEEPPEPFHGYYFRILKAQGAHAEGGAFDYVVDGKMVLGFALVAYPAKYGVSGIMTFIVNQTGVVYEKDLGEDTVITAAAMTTYDPDDSWRRYEAPAAQ